MSLLQQEIDTQNAVAEYYEEIRYRTPWAREYHDWLFGLMIRLLRPRGRILDAGCGTGILAQYLPKEEVWGVDISEKMISHATGRLADARVGNVEDLSYEDETFDTIFARAIIHHLEHPEKGISELARVLKPGGRIIFMDTRDQNIFSKIARKKMTEGEHFSELHQNMKEQSYLSMLEDHFTITEKQYIGYVAYTLLGFPDVFNGYKWVPGKKVLTPLLIWIDQVWVRIPFLNKMALGILVVAKK